MSKELMRNENSAFEITTFEQLERYSKMIAESDFAPKDYKGKPGNVVIAIQFGNELGLKPMQAIQNISVVNGRPMVWGDAALALVRGNPECKGVREWMEGTINGGDAIAYCEVKRNKEIITREFSVAQATKANLIGKGGTWTQYPERMLQLRARGFALRDAFPDVLKGVYIEGETVEDAKFEVINENEQPKLGVQAVKEKLMKSQQAIDVEAINEKTGEIEIKSNPDFDLVKKQMESSKTVDDLILAADMARSLNFQKDLRDELAKIYKEKQKQLEVK